MDYQELYRLQDKVLESVFAGATTFYLTGGTCLHRFYSEMRYSNDLDLFTSDNALYRDDLRIVFDAMQAAALEFAVAVDTRDFVRILVADSLIIDLVNDRVHRHGAAVISDQGYRLDNLINIFANKICAVVGRDEPKDVFDICTLMRIDGITPGEILPAVQRKCTIDLEELEHRFRTFPVELFQTLSVVDHDFLETVTRKYESLVTELLASLG
jgi:predicted nucleotidyltransferase component of viral defense system